MYVFLNVYIVLKFVQLIIQDDMLLKLNVVHVNDHQVKNEI